jgi:hypothetical protein
VAREVTGQLLDQETGTPLVGYTVRGFDLSADGEPRQTSYGITNVRGFFSLVLNTPRDSAPGAPRRLRLHVLDPQANEIKQTEVEASPEQERVVEVRVSASAVDIGTLPDGLAPRQEQQSQRDALVRGLRIVPDDVTLLLDQSVVLYCRS